MALPRAEGRARPKGTRRGLSVATDSEAASPGARSPKAYKEEPFEEVDCRLIARIAAGEGAAFAALYDRHSARVMGLAHRILGDTGEAEAILQEVYEWAWTAAPSFDPSSRSGAAWLLAETRDRAVRRARSAAVIRFWTRAPEPDTAQEVSNGGAWEALCREALLDLPPDERQALRLAYFDGLQPGEIARASGASSERVRALLRSGLMRLRSSLRR